MARALPSLVLVLCTAAWLPAGAQGSACALGSSRFVADADGVRDTRTGLTWSRCNLSRSFDAATGQCTGAAYVTDSLAAAKRAMPALSRESGAEWRLPTVAELRAVFDPSCTREQQAASPFAALDGAPVWSSSTAADGKAWLLDREGNQGRPEFYTADTSAATVLGVRDGRR